MTKYLLIPSIVILCAVSLMAQDRPLSNWRSKVFNYEELPELSDSLSIVESSIYIRWLADSTLLDTAYYRLQGKHILWRISKEDLWATKPHISQPRFLLSYRCYPFDWQASYHHLDSSMMQPSALGEDYIGFDFSPYEPIERLTDLQGLDYSGSFSRGVSFGNSQSLVLNSQFNLQLAGKIANDVEILAAITDQNIPIQPEGNTQQLQEFDKVFIQLKKDNNTLIAGDYELQKPNTHFMNYFKKLQGASFSNRAQLGKGLLSTRASAAIARGKFARNIIAQQEGNQGPYKLRGNQNERFIIIQSGTEKVYLDGQLMKRGLEEDYIIDYNTAHITFTTNRIITKDSRIIVEYEYSDQNFLRSAQAFDAEYTLPNGRLYFHFFSEQDSKTSGNIRDLDSLQLAAIRNSGNSSDFVLTSGIDTLDTFDEFQVKYKLVDTSYQVIINGINTTLHDTILVYSNHPDSARYIASWTDLGIGMGNYLLDNSIAANGRVYRWVAPDKYGNPTGQFEPLIKLNVPNQQQLYLLGAEWKAGKYSSFHIETALSNKDPNRLSKVGDAQNKGMATMAKYNYQRQWKKNWNLHTFIQYEWTQARFRALNPYRNAEFNRDWNRTAGIHAEEHLGTAACELAFKNSWRIRYAFKGFRQIELYNGILQSLKSSWRKNGYAVRIENSWLKAKDQEEKSSFVRPKVELSKQFEKLDDLKLGFYGEREKNSRFAPVTDSLLNNSFFYDLFKIFLETKESEKLSSGLSYTQRYDYTPTSHAFRQATQSSDFNLHGHYRSKSKSRLRWNFNYRQLLIKDSTLTTQKPMETILGELNHSISLFKQLIRSSTGYQISSGQEPKIEYQYIPVASGQGNYQWTDLNQDSTVQLNEIQEIAFQDQGNALRVTIFTDDFIRTNKVQLNQSLLIRAPRQWQKKPFLKWLSRISAQSVLLINRRVRQGQAVSAWNPFQLQVADTSLVSIASRMRKVLYFQRGHELFEAQGGWIDNRKKAALTTGFESRSIKEQYLYSRWNLRRLWSIELRLTKGDKQNDSQFFDNRDYAFSFRRLEPKISFQHSTKFRIAVAYKYEQSKNDDALGGEYATIHDFALELDFRQGTKTKIDLSGSFSQIAFDGSPNSPIELAMLSGLQNGENFQWSLSLHRSLRDNVILQISYEGRKTGLARTVHIGRMMVRASF